MDTESAQLAGALFHTLRAAAKRQRESEAPPDRIAMFLARQAWLAGRYAEKEALWAYERSLER